MALKVTINFLTLSTKLCCLNKKLCGYKNYFKVKKIELILSKNKGVLIDTNKLRIKLRDILNSQGKKQSLVLGRNITIKGYVSSNLNLYTEIFNFSAYRLIYVVVSTRKFFLLFF